MTASLSGPESEARQQPHTFPVRLVSRLGPDRAPTSDGACAVQANAGRGRPDRSRRGAEDRTPGSAVGCMSLVDSHPLRC